ncbi:zinc-binding dehydrogenase domain-containing protein [Sarocladium implicatum]|nr:zinc-binding dehydrogenase domain-containing protein [Sarocladium implicatum]
MPRALTLKKVDGKPGEVYYPLQLKDVPRPKPAAGQLLVQLSAAALNHRDLFQRRHQYRAISFDNPILADGYGTVVELGPDVAKKDLLNKPVILTPMRGWEEDPIGPEGLMAVTGGTTLTEVGTAQDFIVVDQEEVMPAPEHLSAVEGAALPLVGVTAWRALVTKAGCTSPGKNLLITGIGGGVALQTLQFAVAFGVNVYVTSGSQEKLDRAIAMGAKGGVIYRNDSWDKELKALLPKNRPFLDAVVDGAGGKVVSKVVRLLREGGVIAQYGMTVAPKMEWVMPAVLANIELKGTTMGSRREFRDMVAFVNKHGIKPVVSRVVRGLDNLEAINGLFDEMDAGKQFGKLVIEIDGRSSSPSKL